MTAHRYRIPSKRKAGGVYCRLRTVGNPRTLTRWIREGRVFGMYGLCLLTMFPQDNRKGMLEAGRLFLRTDVKATCNHR